MTIHYTTDKVLVKVKKSVAYHFYQHYNKNISMIANLQLKYG